MKGNPIYNQIRQNSPKIDDQAINGLLGVKNSLAYIVDEINVHLGTQECWFGDGGGNTGKTANSLTEWHLQASATPGAWGTEVQLLSPGDINGTDFVTITPVYFDIHKVQITKSNQNDINYEIQFYCGLTTFGAATLCTSIPYRTGGGAAEVSPTLMHMARLSVNFKVWARVKCETANKTLDILLGIHAYKG